jgi:hypothetical protein
VIVNGVAPGAVVAEEGSQPWDLLPDKDALLKRLAEQTPTGEATVDRSLYPVARPPQLTMVGPICRQVSSSPQPQMATTAVP